MLKFVALLLTVLIPLGNIFSMGVPGMLKDKDDYETPEIGGKTTATDDRIHYIKLYDDEYTKNCDAIVIESNGHFGLVDAAYDKESAHGSESGEGVKQYLLDLGVKHLDFVIATHSHSDHIGGMPVIADSSDGHKLVDNNTVYFYKEYTPIQMEDVVEDWNNADCCSNATQAMYNAGAKLFDVSKVSSADLDDYTTNSISGYIFTNNAELDVDPKLKNYISFKFESFDIYLFNLYCISGISENSNSIVTYLEKETVGTALLGDLDVTYDAENKIGEVLKDKAQNNLKVVKIAHHGSSNATSKRLIDTLDPEYAVIQASDFDTEKYPKHSAAFCLYMKENNKTVYYTKDSAGKAIVQVIDDNGKISFVDAKEDGKSLSFKDNTKTMDIKIEKNCFVSWYDAMDCFAPDNIFISKKYVFINDEGHLAKGWVDWKGKKYYLGDDYLMLTSWNKIDGKWYFLKPDGSRANNEYCDGYWLNSDGTWTYEARASWKQDPYGWYYQDTSGWYAKDQWLYIDNYWYYFNNDGYRVTGWQKIDGVWYFFYSDGSMASEEYVNGYKLEYSGKWVNQTKASWKKDSKGWRYLQSDGTYAKEKYLWIDDEQYYFDDEGYMATGWKKINNEYYFFGDNGSMAISEFCEGYWLSFDGKWSYKPQSEWLENSKGRYYQNQIGWYPANQVLWIDGALYHFSSSGYMDTGWQKADGKWYYCLSDGKAVTGWKKIDGRWFYFYDDCVMATGWNQIDGKTYYLRPGGSMASKEYINGYWLNSDGTWTYKDRASWKQDDKGWYYKDTSGWYAKNQTLRIDGKDYTFDKEGYLVE